MITIKHILLVAGCGAFSATQGQKLVERDLYPSGKVQTTRFSDRQVERFMTYYESGRIKEMGAFRDGRRDGVWKQFAEDGTVLARAEFSNGMRQGTWEFHGGGNTIIGRLHYVNGALAKGESFSGDGALSAQRDY